MGYNLRNAKELGVYLRKAEITTRAALRAAAYQAIKKHQRDGVLSTVLVQVAIKHRKRISKWYPK